MSDRDRSLPELLIECQHEDNRCRSTGFFLVIAVNVRGPLSAIIERFGLRHTGIALGVEQVRISLTLVSGGAKLSVLASPACTLTGAHLPCSHPGDVFRRIGETILTENTHTAQQPVYQGHEQFRRRVRSRVKFRRWLQGCNGLIQQQRACY